MMKKFQTVFVVGVLALSAMGMAALTSAQAATTPEATPEVTPEATVEVQTPFLGVGFKAAEGGVEVVEVVVGGPAEAAGILVGDVISAIGEVAVSEANLQETILALAVADTVPVIITRAGETLTVDVTLGVRPADVVVIEPRRIRPTLEIFRQSGPVLGVSIEDAEGGARVVYVTDGSPADLAGLMVDDVITAINGTVIDSAQAAVTAVSAAGEAAEVGTFSLEAVVTRGDETLTLTAELTKHEPESMDMPGNHRRDWRNQRDFDFGGLGIVPRQDGGYNITVPFTPTDPASVTPEVIESLSAIGITLLPVDGEEGAYTLTLPAETLGNGRLLDRLQNLHEGFDFSGPRGRNFRFSVPQQPDAPDAPNDETSAEDSAA